MKSFIIPTSSAEHLARIILNKSRDFKIVFLAGNKEGKRIFPDGGDILFLSPDKGGKRRTNILGAKKNLALVTHGILTSGIRRIQKEQTVDITDLILELIS